MSDPYFFLDVVRWNSPYIFWIFGNYACYCYAGPYFRTYPIYLSESPCSFLYKLSLLIKKRKNVPCIAHTLIQNNVRNIYNLNLSLTQIKQEEILEGLCTRISRPSKSLLLCSYKCSRSSIEVQPSTKHYHSCSYPQPPLSNSLTCLFW